MIGSERQLQDLPGREGLVADDADQARAVGAAQRARCRVAGSIDDAQAVAGLHDDVARAADAAGHVERGQNACDSGGGLHQVHRPGGAEGHRAAARTHQVEQVDAACRAQHAQAHRAAAQQRLDAACAHAEQQAAARSAADLQNDVATVGAAQARQRQRVVGHAGVLDGHRTGGDRIGLVQPQRARCAGRQRRDGDLQRIGRAAGKAGAHIGADLVAGRQGQPCGDDVSAGVSSAGIDDRTAAGLQRDLPAQSTDAGHAYRCACTDHDVAGRGAAAVDQRAWCLGHAAALGAQLHRSTVAEQAGAGKLHQIALGQQADSARLVRIQRQAEVTRQTEVCQRGNPQAADHRHRGIVRRAVVVPVQVGQADRALGLDQPAARNAVQLQLQHLAGVGSAQAQCVHRGAVSRRLADAGTGVEVDRRGLQVSEAAAGMADDRTRGSPQRGLARGAEPAQHQVAGGLAQEHRAVNLAAQRGIRAAEVDRQRRCVAADIASGGVQVQRAGSNGRRRARAYAGSGLQRQIPRADDRVDRQQAGLDRGRASMGIDRPGQRDRASAAKPQLAGHRGAARLQAGDRQRGRRQLEQVHGAQRADFQGLQRAGQGAADIAACDQGQTGQRTGALDRDVAGGSDQQARTALDTLPAEPGAVDQHIACDRRRQVQHCVRRCHQIAHGQGHRRCRRGLAHADQRHRHRR